MTLLVLICLSAFLPCPTALNEGVAMADASSISHLHVLVLVR